MLVYLTSLITAGPTIAVEPDVLLENVWQSLCKSVSTSTLSTLRSRRDFTVLASLRWGRAAEDAGYERVTEGVMAGRPHGVRDIKSDHRY